jgi:hypothetical protein
MKEKFLPIGTVVLLKGGTKEVMITTYCIFPTNTQIVNNQEIKPKIDLFEYGGCLYPEGILDSNTSFAFNHADIEKILFLGYETPKQEELSKKIKDNFEQMRKSFLDSVNK